MDVNFEFLHRNFAPFFVPSDSYSVVAMQSDSDLLHAYIETASQEAFSQLVNRHANWVFTAALRLVKDTHDAEDVTQAVFLVLSQKALVAVRKASLAGWLLKIVKYSAANAVRSKTRRNRHERDAARRIEDATVSGDQVAWEELAARLDNTVFSLRSADREAILLRFYQRLSFAEMGKTLGISEDAAKKRVSKAVKSLRPKLGVSAPAFTATALATVLFERASQAAPPSLIAKCTITENAGVQVHIIAKGAMKIMLTAKLKIVALVIILILSVSTGVRFLLPTALADPAGSQKNVSASTAPATQASDQIAVGDKLAIEVFDVKAIGQSSLLTPIVDKNGDVELQFLKVNVAGLTTDQAAKRINSAYVDAQIARNAKTNVGWVEHALVRVDAPASVTTSTNIITILGDVNKPGQFELKEPLSIKGAIALAGGMTDRHDCRVTVLHVLIPGKLTQMTGFSSLDAISDKSEADIGLKAGDQLIVEKIP